MLQIFGQQKTYVTDKQRGIGASNFPGMFRYLLKDERIFSSKCAKGMSSEKCKKFLSQITHIKVMNKQVNSYS